MLRTILRWNTPAVVGSVTAAHAYLAHTQRRRRRHGPDQQPDVGKLLYGKRKNALHTSSAAKPSISAVLLQTPLPQLHAAVQHALAMRELGRADVMALLKRHRVLRRMDRSLILIEALRQSRCALTSHQYSLLMAHANDAHHTRLALQFWQSAVAEGKVTAPLHGALLSAYRHAGHWQRALAHCETMWADGYVLDAHAVHTVLNACRRYAPSWQHGLAFVQRAVGEKGSVPNGLVYLEWLRVLAQSTMPRRWACGLAMLESMHRGESARCVVSHMQDSMMQHADEENTPARTAEDSLFRSASRASQTCTQENRLVWAGGVEESPPAHTAPVEVTAGHYGAVLQMLGGPQRWQRGVQLFARMMQRGVQPSRDTVTALLLLRPHDMTHVVRCVALAHRLGMPVTDTMYRAVLIHLFRRGLDEQASRFIARELRRDGVAAAVMPPNAHRIAVAAHTSSSSSLQETTTWLNINNRPHRGVRSGSRSSSSSSSSEYDTDTSAPRAKDTIHTSHPAAEKDEWSDVIHESAYAVAEDEGSSGSGGAISTAAALGVGLIDALLAHPQPSRALRLYAEIGEQVVGMVIPASTYGLAQGNSSSGCSSTSSSSLGCAGFSATRWLVHGRVGVCDHNILLSPRWESLVAHYDSLFVPFSSIRLLVRRARERAGTVQSVYMERVLRRMQRALGGAVRVLPLVHQLDAHRYLMDRTLTGESLCALHAAAATRTSSSTRHKSLTAGADSQTARRADDGVRRNEAGEERRMHASEAACGKEGSRYEGGEDAECGLCLSPRAQMLLQRITSEGMSGSSSSHTGTGTRSNCKDTAMREATDAHNADAGIHGGTRTTAKTEPVLRIRVHGESALYHADAALSETVKPAHRTSGHHDSVGTVTANHADAVTVKEAPRFTLRSADRINSAERVLAVAVMLKTLNTDADVHLLSTSSTMQELVRRWNACRSDAPITSVHFPEELFVKAPPEAQSPPPRRP